MEHPVLALLIAGAPLEQVRGALLRTEDDALATVIVRMIAFAAHLERDRGQKTTARKIAALAESCSERLRRRRDELASRPITAIDRARAARARFDRFLGGRR